MAGCYNRLTSAVAGREVENEDMVNLPNWLPLRFRTAGGDWLTPDTGKVLDHRQTVHLDSGVLERLTRFGLDGDRLLSVRQLRLVHMADPHLAALRTEFTVEGGPAATVQVRDPRPRQDARGADGTDGHHLTHVHTDSTDDTVWLRCRTRTSDIRIGMAARTTADAPVTSAREHLCVTQRAALRAEPGRTVTVDKVVALHTSRDPAISDPLQAAVDRVAEAPGFYYLLVTHRAAWGQLWRRAELDVPGEAGSILRLHLFHVLQTLSPHTADLDVGVPARGLHGEAYRGHVFWDELFVLPYLNLHFPEVSRALLHYRHRRLEKARAAARAIGRRGALYPWQSGSDGREETQQLHLNPRSGRWLPDHSHLQHHVGSAIAYNVWQYCEASGDAEFLHTKGAEMLAADRALLGRLRHLGRAPRAAPHPGCRRPRRVPRGLSGCRPAGPGRQRLHQRHRRRAGPHPRSPRRPARAPTPDSSSGPPWTTRNWNSGTASPAPSTSLSTRASSASSRGTATSPNSTGRATASRYGDIRRLDRLLEAENDSVNNYQASKQADVLMLGHLFSPAQLRSLFRRLGYSLDERTWQRTVDHYLARTSHGSTLSGLVHGWILARARRADAWTYVQEALKGDVADLQGGTTGEGIHLGAMAGTLDLVQRGLTGLETRAGALWLDPYPLPELSSYGFSVRYQGHWGVRLRLEHGRWRSPARPPPDRCRSTSGCPTARCASSRATPAGWRCRTDRHTSARRPVSRAGGSPCGGTRPACRRCR
ncbi:glycosyl hydrolase family 65 protein [Streptomyces violaceorubidus]